MWTNISGGVSALAEKAKEAAALIETQINDSLGEVSGSPRQTSRPSAAGAEEDGSDDGAGGGSDGGSNAPRSSDGWEKCDDDISSSDDSGEKINKQPDEKETKPQEMSFVDLKAAVQEIPKNPSGEPETDAALLDALARIEALEKQVHSLKDELAAAREESQNYHATNLLLEQQVKELQEENATLKEGAESGK